MPICKNVAGCPYFNDDKKGRYVLSYADKQKYCKEDNTGCARYMVSHRFGKGSVPKNLAPHEQNRAKKILSRLSKENGSENYICEEFETCRMFVEYLPETSSLVNSFQEKFCLVNKSECARYILFQQIEPAFIPDDLYPNERTRAMAILKGN